MDDKQPTTDALIVQVRDALVWRPGDKPARLTLEELAKRIHLLENSREATRRYLVEIQERNRKLEAVADAARAYGDDHFDPDCDGCKPLIAALDALDEEGTHG